MIIQKLHSWLTTAREKPATSQLIFWFTLSLTFSLIYGFDHLRDVFANNYIVQDDARQHVVWMMRYVSPDFFPNDLVADYFQSVAPEGYKIVYKLGAFLGFNPLIFNKLLPPLIGLVTTIYAFGFFMQMLPIPAASFLGTLLLNQNLWMRDDIPSATPRAFLYPFFLAFLYYLAKRSLLGTSAAIILLGLFYPQTVLIASGILVIRLVTWESGKLQHTSQRRDYWLSGIGLASAFLVLLPYVLMDSPFAPEITVSQARALPEFWSGGRSSFFNDDPMLYWLGGRSGLLTNTIFTPIPLVFGLFLPLLLPFPSVFPLVQKLTENAKILLQILIVSLGLFFAAHATLFTLYLPSRYTQHTLTIILAFSAAIALTILIDAAFCWAEKSTQFQLINIGKSIFVLGITALVWISCLTYPLTLGSFPKGNYMQGDRIALYQFFAQQPKDIFIGGIAGQTSYIPAFSYRSVLFSPETAIPYHWGYY
ncbi:MAG: hypothetical protein ACOC1Z_06025, partial [Cyanobacteriota bacterium]